MKQSLYQRTERIAKDALQDDSTDIFARWNQVVDDGIANEAIAALGAMPDATLDDVDLKTAVDYAARDADATLRVRNVLDPMIDKTGLRQALEMDLAVVPILCCMMEVGMLVDREHFSMLTEVFNDQLRDTLSRIESLAGGSCNPSSGDQVANLLFGKLGLGARRKTKSGKRYTTDDKALETLRHAHPVVPLILDYRELTKLKGTYSEKLPTFIAADGRIHPNLSLTRVPSGRLACEDPNLLAIPVRTELGRLIRAGFIAPPECVLASFDLDQIEMRVMAHESRDERMLQAYRDGLDIHTQTASLMFKTKIKNVTVEQRHHGKQVGFGIINGITALGLLDQMFLRGATDWDEADCQRLLDKYLVEVYPGVGRMFERTWAECRSQGFVRDLWGRLRYLPGVHSTIPKVKAEAERQATNHKIQGGAQGIIKLAMKGIWDYWLNEYHEWDPLLQVHDELLFEMGTDVARGKVPNDILNIMESIDVLDVPVRAHYKVADNWGSLKD